MVWIFKKIFHEIFWSDGAWPKEQLNNFGGNPDRNLDPEILKDSLFTIVITIQSKNKTRKSSTEV